MPTTVREATDAPGERSLVENGQATFAFMLLDGNLMVSTKEDSDMLSSLPGWRMLLPGGKDCIKRFEVHLSLEAFLNHLRAIYGKDSIKVLGR